MSTIDQKQDTEEGRKKSHLMCQLYEDKVVVSNLSHTWFLEREREMAEAGHLVSARNVSPIPSFYPTKANSLKFQCRIRAASKRNDFSLVLWTPFGS